MKLLRSLVGALTVSLRACQCWGSRMHPALPSRDDEHRPLRLDYKLHKWKLYTFESVTSERIGHLSIDPLHGTSQRLQGRPLPHFGSKSLRSLTF